MSKGLVWKFKLPSLNAIDGDRYVFGIMMPKYAKIIHTECQNNIPCVWALVNPNADMVKRKFYCVGTGWGSVDDNDKYVGSIQQGNFVWHIFEE